MAGKSKPSKQDKKVQAKREEVQRRIQKSYEEYRRSSSRRSSESSLDGRSPERSSSDEEGSQLSQGSLDGRLPKRSSSDEEGLPNPEQIRSEVSMLSKSSLIRRKRVGSSPEGEGQQSSESSLEGDMPERPSSIKRGQQPSKQISKKRRKKGQPSKSSSPSDMLAGIPNTGQPISQNSPWRSASSSSGDMLGESVLP